VHTVRVDGVGVPLTIAQDDQANNVFVQTYDPDYGWLRQGAGQHAYYVQRVSPSIQTEGATPEPPSRYEVWRRIGDASAAATRQHFVDANGTFLDDLRQSVAGGLMSAFTLDFSSPPNFVDEVNIPAGTPASLAQVPPSDGPQPPRFMTSSNDLYMVTTIGRQVKRYTPAGGPVSILFDLSAPMMPFADRIVDFALAPDDNTFAAVVEQDSKGTVTSLWMGTLAAGVQASTLLGFNLSVNEMVWHPLQTGVFLDLSGQTVGLYKLNDDDGFYISQNNLQTVGMNNVDVNRLDGRIATLFPSGGPQAVLRTEAALPPGIYIWPPDASSFSVITPQNVTDPQSVRWLATWRNAAGRSSARVR
jgi:hypothetical protein